jgi:hypothetical protein
MKLLISMLLLGGFACTAEDDFPAVMAEPNLEKRSELALKEADKTISAAKVAYEQQKMSEFRERLTDTEELVQLSYKSLQDTGKRARRNPKWFKRAEMNMRGLMRRLDSLSNDVGLEDREAVIAVRKSVGDVHETVLHDIMTKK